MKKFVTDYSLIALGALLYAVGTVLFVFPNKILLGGTSGISVILSDALPLSAGTFSVILNTLLLITAFILLGKNMATKTLVGSALTTVFIGGAERIIKLDFPIVENDFLAAVLGAGIIAIASGIMFYVDSSSGGTDILALILRKYVRIDIGKALFITDVTIVIVGGVLSGLMGALSSTLGFLVKVFGIDAVIRIIRKINLKRLSSPQENGAED